MSGIPPTDKVPGDDPKGEDADASGLVVDWAMAKLEPANIIPNDTAASKQDSCPPMPLLESSDESSDFVFFFEA